MLKHGQNVKKVYRILVFKENNYQQHLLIKIINQSWVDNSRLMGIELLQKLIKRKQFSFFLLVNKYALLFEKL